MLQCFSLQLAAVAHTNHMYKKEVKKHVKSKKTKNYKTKLHGRIPQANYTERVMAACANLCG
jgi:hypothetical protein